jgi:hypothetical protein
MKAFLIDPASKRIESVEFDGTQQRLQALIGFATIDSDEIDANGDRLFFDEECFLRAVPGAGRFQLDTLAPVAGRGVIVGSKANGAELADPVIGAEALAARVRFV